MKKKYCLLIFLLALIIPGFVLNAVVVSSAGRQNVNETIRGNSISYTFDVPLHWQTHMDVNLSVFVSHPNIVERLVFYYNPSSTSFSSAVILELAVFTRDRWNDDLGYTMLTETDTHIFAIRPAASNPFVFGSDRLIFNNLLREASNPAFLINYISVPQGSDTIVRNTVSVNGVRMNAPSHTNALRVVSVPLRETAEALGYSVDWDAATGNISISSGTFHTTIGRNISTRQRHNIVNVNGVSYVSTMFFLQVLGCNVEIDEHSNVRITRTSG